MLLLVLLSISSVSFASRHVVATTYEAERGAAGGEKMVEGEKSTTTKKKKEEGRRMPYFTLWS